MKTVNNLIEFEKNSLQQEGEDIINFSQPLAITDDSRQWNMTKYDINSLDITTYDGTVTADHGQNISDVIGKVVNLRKEGNKVLIDGIKFAIKENPLAVLAKNLMKGGFVTGVSIETIGDEADDTLTWKNHKLAGLSVVAHPNNRNAYAVIANSVQEAKKLGLNTNNLELLEKEKSIYFSDKKDYNITMETNGGPGSGNHAPGEGRGVGKPHSDGFSGSSSSSSKETEKSSSAKEFASKINDFYEKVEITANYDDYEKGVDSAISDAEQLVEDGNKPLRELREIKKEIDFFAMSLDNDIDGANETKEEDPEFYEQISGDKIIKKAKEAESKLSEISSKAQENLDTMRQRIEGAKSDFGFVKREFYEADRRLKDLQDRFASGEYGLLDDAVEAKAEYKKVREKYLEVKKFLKEYDNSIFEKIENNSVCLTRILNAGKGNPYHDKDGKFTTGSGANSGTSTGSSSLADAKAKYEREQTLYDNIDYQKKGDDKELIKSKIALAKAYEEAIKSKQDELDVIVDKVEKAERKWDRISDKLKEAVDMGDYAEIEEYRIEEKEAHEKYDKLWEKQDKVWKEKLDLMHEYSDFKKSKSEKSTKNKDEISTKKAKPLSSKTQKKIDDITKKFPDNSLSIQIKNNSKRLTVILNNGKGNPYHDKEGKFCSGPNKAFNSDIWTPKSESMIFPFGSKGFSNHKDVNIVYNAALGMRNIGWSIDPTSSTTGKPLGRIEEVQDFLSNRSGKFFDDIKKIENTSLSNIAKTLRKNSSDFVNIMKERDEKFAIKNSNARDVALKQNSKIINTKIKQLEQEGRSYTLDNPYNKAMKFANDSVIGMYQTLKYLK